MDVFCEKEKREQLLELKLKKTPEKKRKRSKSSSTKRPKKKRKLQENPLPPKVFEFSVGFKKFPGLQDFSVQTYTFFKHASGDAVICYCKETGAYAKATIEKYSYVKYSN